MEIYNALLKVLFSFSRCYDDRAEDYAPSSQRLSSSSSHLEQQEHQEEFERCENGWCAEDGSCSCNPCWSGPTCQEYGK